MSRMSNAFRANIDSIEAAMQGLGLTVEDLSDSENMTLLAQTMDEGAALLGLPQIESVEDTVTGLLNGDDFSGKPQEIPELPGSGAVPGAGNDDDSDSDTEVKTKIVNSGGVTYLETEKTSSNGTTITSRTLIGSMSNTSAMRGGASAFGGMPTIRSFSGASGIDNFSTIKFLKA